MGRIRKHIGKGGEKGGLSLVWNRVIFEFE